MVFCFAVSSTIPTQEEELAKQKKANKKKSKKQAASADDDLPFLQKPKESRKAFYETYLEEGWELVNFENEDYKSSYWK